MQHSTLYLFLRSAALLPALVLPSYAALSYTCAPNIDATHAGSCAYLNSTITALYDNTFSNVTASIYIQYGSTGLGESTVGFGNQVTYTAYFAALTTAAQASGNPVQQAAVKALNSLDTSLYGNGMVEAPSALLTALAIKGIGDVVFGTNATGTSSCTTPGTSTCFNGIITITNDPDTPLFYRTAGTTEPSDAYDFYSVVEHETDEILGTASCIDSTGPSLEDDCSGRSTPSAVDLFRYQSAGNLVLIGTTPGAYFSYNGGQTNGAGKYQKGYNTLDNGDDYADFVSSNPCQAQESIQDAVGCPGFDAGLDITNDGGAEINILNAVGYKLASTEVNLTASPTSVQFSYIIGITTPAPQTVSLVSNGAVLTYTAVATVASPAGGTWLSVTPSGGATTGTATGVSLSISYNPAGLAAGTYTGSVTVSANGAANSPLAIPVTLVVSSQPALQTSVSSLTFNALAGGTNPASQSIQLTSSAPSLAQLSFTSSATSAPLNWLSVTGTGTTPGTVTASLAIGGLAAGTYSGSVVLTSAGAANSPVSIPVTLNVGQPTVTITPTSLTFTAQRGGASPAAQTLSLASNAANVSFTATPSSSGWLSVSPASGTTGTSANVLVNPAGLAVGSYSGQINFSLPGAADSTIAIPVQLTITAPVSLTASPTSVQFSHFIGITTPAPQTVSLVSNGAVLTYTAVATVASPAGGTWLSVTPSGSATTGTATGVSLSISYNPAGLAPGTYTGSVNLSATGAANSPLVIPVTLVVSSQPALQTSVSSLTFNALAGGPNPASQSIQVTSSAPSLAQLSFTSSATSAPLNWLSVTGNGTTPGTVTASVALGGLAAGIYSGSVILTSAGAANSPVSIPVTLNVGQPTVTITPTSLTFTAQRGGASPAPQTLSLTSNAGNVSFTATPSSSGWLGVSPGSGTSASSANVLVNPAGLAAASYTGQINFSLPGAADSTIVIPVRLTITAPVSEPGVFRQNFAFFLNASGSDAFNSPGDLNFNNFIAPQPGDIPVVGDWTGSGTTKIGIFREGTWFLDLAGNGVFNAAVDAQFTFGQAGDTPVVGDWTGNGKSKIGVVRPFTAGGPPALWVLDYDGNGTMSANDLSKAFAYGGIAGDVPIVGDWTGNGITKVGVVRPFAAGGVPSFWLLDANNDHAIDAGDQIFAFGGIAGDIPIAGDWNGSGTSKAGVVRPFSPGTPPAFWILDGNGSAPTVLGSNDIVAFPYGGIAGDIPVVGRW